MRKHIRRISTILVLMLASAMILVSCQIQERVDSTTKPTTSGTITGTTTKVETSLGPDFMTKPGELPIVTKPTTLVLGIKPHQLVTDYKDNYLTRYVKERTGIDVEFFFFPAGNDEAQQKVELMVSSNQKLPDIIAGIPLSEKAILTYGQQGIIRELSDYFENLSYFWKESNEKWCSDYEIKKMELYSHFSDGGQYVFPTLYESPSEAYVHGYYINTHWLEKLGLKMPTTLAELKTVLEAFRDNDPNNNGKRDEIPAMGYTNDTTGDLVQLLINSFIYYSDYKMNVEDGVVYAPFVTDKFKEALKYIKSWVDEGLITELTFTQDRQQAKKIIDVGSLDEMVVGFVDMYPALLFSSHTEVRASYYPLKCLPGPDGEYHTPRRLTSADFDIFITKYCEYPEVAFRFLDFLCEEECTLTSRWGEKNVNWVYQADTDKKLEARYKHMGFDSYWYYIKNPFTYENNEIWIVESLMHLPNKLFNSQGWTPSDNPIQRKSLEVWNEGIGMRYLDNNVPDETIEKLVYTLDEMNQLSDIEMTIFTYVDESVTRFMMGELSVDKDWDKYLQDLNKMGLERYVEIVQNAYTRMNSK